MKRPEGSTNSEADNRPPLPPITNRQSSIINRQSTGELPATENPQPTPFKRRKRYSGKNPRRYEEKYKEHAPTAHPDTIQKVIASGKTPAGTHRPILVQEILQILNPKPGETALDATLGYGGHTSEILPRLLPAGRLIGLDVDPIELPKTEARLRAAGYTPENFIAIHSNFAGAAKALATRNLPTVDIILADLGVSSMQYDRPDRGFSYKHDGPLDMRLNPNRGPSAQSLLQTITPEKLTQLLQENADEPRAELIAQALHQKRQTLHRTTDLTNLLRQTLRTTPEETDQTIRRVFQALRIAVNEEFSALENFLRLLPALLNPNGRVAILTFHSGEDRRVKKAFQAHHQSGLYSSIATEVIRPTREETHTNPRATPAKLRWATKS